MDLSFKRAAPIVVRLGIAAVVMWFGASEILHPSQWVSFIPTWASTLTGISALTLVTVNAIAEIVLSFMLAFGIWTRLAGGLLFLHMVLIIIDVGLSAIGVRDVGLAFALLSIFLQGSDDATLSA